MEGNILRVFLASPSDLKKERKRTKDVVDRLNKSVARVLHLFIDLLGWEDTPSGTGRPQSIINKEVDECDLFLALLWQRWGSSTNGFSSGFEEEFTRAFERFQREGKPEIWLFFKKVDNKYSDDPGPQQIKVLDFRRQEIQLKRVLFKEFKTPQDWEKLIHDDLSTFIVKLEKPITKAAAQDKPIPVEPEIMTVSKGKAINTTKDSVYPNELHELFSKLNQLAIKEDPTALRIEDHARLGLLTSAWISMSYTKEILSVHQINVHYRYGAGWNLTLHERVLIIRSLIGDTYDTRPGWKWFRISNDEDFFKILLRLSYDDSDPDVRKGAFSLLADIGFYAPSWYVRIGIQDKEDAVVLEAIRLFKTSEDSGNIDLLQPLLSSNSTLVRSAASSARIELLFSQNPDDAFTQLIGLDVLSSIDLFNIADNMDFSKVKKELLFKALKEGGLTLRAIVARYLRKSNLLSIEICQELLKDTNLDVREESLIALVELGEEVDINYALDLLSGTIPKGNEVVTHILQKRDLQSLLSLVDFYSSDGHLAYQVLAISHFKEFSDKIRMDLDDNFESLFGESKNRMRATYGKQAEDIISSWNPDIIEFLRSQFIKAALSGLALKGLKKDKKYAWKYLGKTKYGMGDPLAIQILEKSGDKSDAKKLLRFATTANGEVKKRAVKVALRLSDSIEGILLEMLSSNDSELLAISISALSLIPSPESVDLAMPFIYHENDEIRLKALSVLIQQCERESLEQLLSDYQEKHPYYYNVVTWLDRYLYAPGRFGEFFKKKLAAMLNDITS